MKTVKKYSAIIIVVFLVAFIMVILFGNKAKMDNELKAMQEYSSIVPVEIIIPKELKASQTIQENGTLRSSAEVSILSETSGKVLTVVGNVGEHVKAGQTLVVVEKEVLESQFNLAKANLENAEKDMNRFNNLAGGEAITQQQLEATKLSYQNALTNFTIIKKQLENTVIQSPVNGVISKRSVEKGAYITPSLEMFSILEQNQMVIVVKVSEKDIFQLNKGQTASITLDALSGKTFSGSIRSIGVVADLSGRYEVEIGLTNNDMFLRSGMSGKASFENTMENAGIIIPRKCIVGSINNAKVFVLNGDSVALKEVKAITVNETETLITEGLLANEKVVLSGQINLQDGSKVKVINQ